MSNIEELFLQQSAERFQIIRQYKLWHNQNRCTDQEFMNVVYLAVHPMTSMALTLGYSEIHQLCETILGEMRIPNESIMLSHERANMMEMLQRLETEFQRISLSFHN